MRPSRLDNHDGPVDLEKQFSKLIAYHQGVKESRSAATIKPVDITQYPLVRTTNSNSSLIILGINMDRNERLNMNCLMDSPVEVTYCPQDIIDVLMNNNSMII